MFVNPNIYIFIQQFLEHLPHFKYKQRKDILGKQMTNF
jgi:hypothetical protein